jgi:acylphosphatase
VQGVGFRPFVYNIAQQLGVVGEVYNDSAGVVIFLQCTHTQFKQFLFRLKSNTPALATITKIKTKDCQIEKYLDFSIAQSRSGEVATRVLPDASICDDCIDDNRRYRYKPPQQRLAVGQCYKPKENYQQSTEAAIEFYTEEFNKMLKEHMKQYEVVFDKKSSTKKK